MKHCKHCNYSLETACPFDLTGTCKNNIVPKRKKFYIHDMDITFDTELTQEEMEQRFFSALRGIGVIGHRGCPN